MFHRISAPGEVLGVVGPAGWTCGVEGPVALTPRGPPWPLRGRPVLVRFLVLFSRGFPLLDWYSEERAGRRERRPLRDGPFAVKIPRRRADEQRQGPERPGRPLWGGSPMPLARLWSA